MEQRPKKRGDRFDGYWLRDEAPALGQFMAYLMPNRADNEAHINVDVDTRPLDAFLAKKNEGLTEDKYTYLHVFLAAMVKCFVLRPRMNRFISGTKRIYSHKDFTVSMVVLRPGGGDTMSKITIKPQDTIFSVQDAINNYVADNRVENSNSLDKTMNVILNMGFLVSFIGTVLRFLDKHGWLPKVLINASPFHASLLISNLASIRTNHIYHHVYEFGTTSVGITMGNTRLVARQTKDGVVFDKCMPLGVVMDERIASGHYIAQAFTRFKSYLKNPELLEEPFNTQTGIETYAEIQSAC